MGNYNILKDWITKSNLRAVVLRVDLGHRCGYVGISESHKLFGKSYSEHIDCLAEVFKPNETVLGKRGVIPVSFWDGETISMNLFFNVHGSVNYSAANPSYPVASRLHWIGFSCDHSGDSVEKCNLDYCINECESLALQLSEFWR